MMYNDFLLCVFLFPKSFNTHQSVILNKCLMLPLIGKQIIQNLKKKLKIY